MSSRPQTTSVGARIGSSRRRSKSSSASIVAARSSHDRSPRITRGPMSDAATATGSGANSRTITAVA